MVIDIYKSVHKWGASPCFIKNTMGTFSVSTEVGKSTDEHSVSYCARLGMKDSWMVKEEKTCLFQKKVQQRNHDLPSIFWDPHNL